MISAPFLHPVIPVVAQRLDVLLNDSPQILHLYLADPAFRQVAAVLVPSTSTYSCSWASAFEVRRQHHAAGIGVLGHRKAEGFTAVAAA